MNEKKDTAAWIFQTWASFALSITITSIGIAYLPVSIWIQAFLAMGLLFTVGSSFTLAKTIRDNHEADKILNRLKEAKAEKIIREFSDAA
jgi:hypothetical protein